MCYIHVLIYAVCFGILIVSIKYDMFSIVHVYTKIAHNVW